MHAPFPGSNDARKKKGDAEIMHASFPGLANKKGDAEIMHASFPGSNDARKKKKRR